MSKRLKRNDTATLELLYHHFPIDVARSIEDYILPIELLVHIKYQYQYAKSGHFELCWKEIIEEHPYKDSQTLLSQAIDPILTFNVKSVEKVFMPTDLIRKMIYLAVCFDNDAMITCFLNRNIADNRWIIWEISKAAHDLKKWKFIEIIMDRVKEHRFQSDFGLSSDNWLTFSRSEMALVCGCTQNRTEIVEMCLDNIPHSNPVWEYVLSMVCTCNIYSNPRLRSLICENIVQDFHCGYCGVSIQYMKH